MGVVTERPGLPVVSDYLRFLRRHRLLFVCLIGVGLLAGMAWSMRQPSTYSASVSIAIAPVPKYVTTPNELLPPEVTIDTDAQLLTSPQVVNAIADTLGIDPAGVAQRVRVTASANTHVLHVTVTSGSRTRAADAANAAAAAFIDVRRVTLGALSDSQLDLVRVKLATQEDLLNRTQSRRLVVTETDELFAEVLSLRGALDELEEARAQPAQVIVPADPPRRADYANTEVPVTSGPMLGLLAGCLLGAARDRGLLRAPAHAPRIFVHPVRRPAG
jgi:uncharacterized protein involved in exopolysaccharide biosynthesis